MCLYVDVCSALHCLQLDTLRTMAATEAGSIVVGRKRNCEKERTWAAERKVRRTRGVLGKARAPFMCN